MPGGGVLSGLAYDLVLAAAAVIGVFALIALTSSDFGRRLVAIREDDGLAENTLVVFWSDHGASFPRAKRWANEAGVRVPLIARWPGRIPAGTARPEVVQMLVPVR